MKRIILLCGLFLIPGLVALQLALGHGKPPPPPKPPNPGRWLGDKVGGPPAPPPAATTPTTVGPTGATTRGPGGQGPTTGGARPVGARTSVFRRAGARTGARPMPREKLPERWELWWAYNADAYLGLRARRLEGHTRTAGDGNRSGLLGAGGVRPSRPSIEAAARPALITALGSDDVEIVDSAALAVGRSTSAPIPAQVAAGLRQALVHPKSSAKEAAALAMGLIGDRSSRGLLRELADDTVAGRSAAAAPKGVPVLVRAYAAMALGMIGDPRDLALLRELIDRHPRGADEIASGAVLGLGLSRRPEVIPYLIELIDRVSASSTVRAMAPIALGKLECAETRSASPLLIQALRSINSPTQLARSLVIAMGRIATLSDEASLKALGRVTGSHSDAQTRHFARIALAEIAARDTAGREDQPATYEQLVHRLLNDLGRSGRRSSRPWSALATAIALRPQRASHSPLLASATQVLATAMERSATISEKTAIALALGLLGAREQGTSIRRLLDEADDPVHVGALAIALALLDAREAAPRLRSMIRDGATDWFLRRDLARALAILDQRGGLETLLEMLGQGRSKYETASVIMALGFLDDARAVPPLVALLEHPHRAGIVRGMAAEALGLLGEKTILPWRSRILGDHNYRLELHSISQMVEWN